MNDQTLESDSPIRVALVEDIAAIRESLKTLISESAGLELVGAAVSGEEALDLLPALQPDVVLMDIVLPKMSGVECVRLLKETLPEVEFMMLTIIEEHASVFASLQAGATGYLVKGLAGSRLVEAIRELHAGGAPMSSSIARRVIQRMLKSEDAEPPESNLSFREQEVLQLLASGQRYKEIADSLNLSAHTVRTHIHHIYGKLQARTKAEAIRIFRHRNSEAGHK